MNHREQPIEKARDEVSGWSDLRVRIEQALADNGIAGNEDGLHSWRCAYPGLYGACTCVEELIDDLVRAVTDHAAE